ncbi:MAG: hypothetical protein KC636_20835, partial [Myxococcales bacterium]|nr:hypothetical protein [Myxococcales bacterium]
MLRRSVVVHARSRGLLIAAASVAALTSGVARADLLSLQDRPHGNVMGDGLRLTDGLDGPVAVESCADGEVLLGIDVSYYQGSIDWNAVAADGVKFAWVRVSHSTAFFDPQFDANLAGARAAGIHTGVYQYFEPTEDPIAQADLLLEHMGPLVPGDLPPMIDVESVDKVPPGPYADAIRAWLDHVEAATGVKGFIYTGYYYWNDNVGTDEFVDHPLWIANYNPGCPLIPDYWGKWTIHQYCACESIAGIAGDVDGDHFNGDLAALEQFTVDGGECGDLTCGGGEDPYNCPQDCPPCGVIGSLGGAIDNGEPCYELYGNDMYWRDELVGEGGSLVWTNATDYDVPYNYAIWRLFFAETGAYEVEVHIEQPYGETQQAAYQIGHAGGVDVVPLSQAGASGWVSLGEYTFTAGQDHFVRLDDNTGEQNDLQISIVYDALRVTRLDPPMETGSTGDP